MPDIIGLSVEQAESVMSELGFELNIQEEYNEATAGAIAESEYTFGQNLNDAGKRIDVVVSKGTLEQEIQYLKDNDQEVSYEELLRNPTKYEEIPLRMNINVSKVDEQKILGIEYATKVWALYGGETVIITEGRDVPEPALLEGDNVTIYGYGNGTSTIDVKQKEYQGSLALGFSYNKTVDTYKVPDIKIMYVEF